MGRSACVTCHQRKVKCDAQIQGFPCSNCISSRKSDCRIHQKKRGALARSINDPVQILSRSTTANRSNRGSQSLQALQDNLNELRSPQSPGLTTTIHAQQQQAETYGGTDYLADLGVLGARAIHKGIRITYVGKDVSNISFLVRQQQQKQRLVGQKNENKKAYHFPSTEIARKYMRHESDRVPSEAFMLPEKALADELVTAYFTHVNPACPILDEEVFMAQYGGQDPADPPSLLVLQAVLLVGAHVARGRGPERDVLKKGFFRRAKLLFNAGVEWNRDYMVQAALLLTWYEDGVEDVAANAWYWVGVAERIAIGLGMHRDTAGSSLARSDKHRWRRIWWMLFQHDVTVSLFYGRPQAINLDECNVAPLNALDLEGCHSEIQIEYVLKYTELCILISRVLRSRFAIRMTTTEQHRKATLASADEALAKWCLLLPPSLHLRSSGSVWTSKLHLAYNNFLILLHRPSNNPRAASSSSRHRPNDSAAAAAAAAAVGGRGGTTNDADICIAAATAITTIFEDMRKRDQIRHVGLADVNALFTSLIQISVELRFFSSSSCFFSSSSSSSSSSNPILGIYARRRFDSALISLREVAGYWVVVGEGILRLFEGGNAMLLRRRRRCGWEGGGGDSAVITTPPTTTSNATTTITTAPARTDQSSSTSYNNPQPQNSTAASHQTSQHHDTHGPPRSDLDVLTAAADAAVQSIQAGLIEQEREEVSDWRLLFPFTSLSSSSSPDQGVLGMLTGDMMMSSSSSSLLLMEDEWREIYWQEPNMFETFGDIFGGGGVGGGNGSGSGWL